MKNEYRHVLFVPEKRWRYIYICMYIYIHIYIQTFISIYFLHTQKYIELEIDRQILQGRKCRYKNIVIKIWHLIFIYILYIQQCFYINCYLLQHTKPSKTELYRVDYTKQNISVIPSRLYRTHRSVLLFRVGYTKLNITATSNTLC